QGSGPVRGDDLAAGEQFAGVLEDHDTVAEQRPALLRVAGDGAGRLAIGCVCVGALRQVRAHGCPLVRCALVALSLQFGSMADVVEPFGTGPEVTIWYQTTTVLPSAVWPGLAEASGSPAGCLGSRTMPVSRWLSRRVSSRSASMVQALTGVVAMAL